MNLQKKSFFIHDFNQQSTIHIMNKIISGLIFSISFFLFTVTIGNAQSDTTEFVRSKIYVVTTMNGGIFVGPIITDNAQVLIIKTNDRGEVSIPKYQVKTMKELEEGQLNKDGEYVSDPLFSTRYFITTNSFPMKKGDNYICKNLFGPEAHFGVGEKFGIGVMTSWFGVPIIGTVKYSINLGENANLGIGALVGTGSWASPEFFGALPFGTLTFGTRKSNINFSAGYGAISLGNGSDGTSLFSVAGAIGGGGKISFVFDSFILPINQIQSTSNPNTGSSTSSTYKAIFALIIPGIRIQTNDDKALQMGFAGIYFDGDIAPLPIPMVTWFRRL